jgi:hypothetical protein
MRVKCVIAVPLLITLCLSIRPHSSTFNVILKQSGSLFAGLFYSKNVIFISLSIKAVDGLSDSLYCNLNVLCCIIHSRLL